MNKKRLLKLAGLLVKDSRRKSGIKFNLNTWGHCKHGKQPSVSCGTQACAMGLAAISGEFKRAGLGFLTHENNLTERTTIEITFKRFSSGGIYSASQLFGIDNYTANWLFLPSFYGRQIKRGAAGERRVAKRIRDFVAGKAAP